MNLNLMHETQTLGGGHIALFRETESEKERKREREREREST